MYSLPQDCEGFFQTCSLWLQIVNTQNFDLEGLWAFKWQIGTLLGYFIMVTFVLSLKVPVSSPNHHSPRRLYTPWHPVAGLWLPAVFDCLAITQLSKSLLWIGLCNFMGPTPNPVFQTTMTSCVIHPHMMHTRKAFVLYWWQSVPFPHPTVSGHLIYAQQHLLKKCHGQHGLSGYCTIIQLRFW